MFHIITVSSVIPSAVHGKIGFLRFVMDSENADDYLEWCRSHGTDPSDESAEFYVEQTDIEQMDRQVMDDDSYGIWN